VTRFQRALSGLGLDTSLLEATLGANEPTFRVVAFPYNAPPVGIIPGLG
jgi:hypothetical protein